MKQLLIILLLLITLKSSAQINCSDALQQLQNYAGQVNQIYYNEYWTIIPNQRCPAADAWGRPYAPIIVQNCRSQMLGYLNNWYTQQCVYVNNWYMSIARTCASQNSVGSTPAPKRSTGSTQAIKINTQKIEELSAGVDENKMVKITIPDSPDGFNGN